MKSYQTYQIALLQQIKKQVGINISKEIEAAFLDTPRHLFIDKFLDHNSEKEIVEIEVTAENLSTHLPLFYKNNPVGLAKNEVGEVISTISQPSAVLMMLQKLDIQKGHKVLEIGTASGWNAAMMSKLVGINGRVFSIEIIADLAQRAKVKMKSLNLTNVQIFDGDGAVKNYQEQFDRIMFTVGAYDVPSIIHSQLKQNGLLFMVVRNKGLYEDLMLLRNKGDYLESIESSPSRFVPLTGKYAMSDLDAILLENLPLWEKVKENIVARQAFWFGISSKNPRTNLIKLAGITTFLGIVEPCFRLIKNKENTLSFGLIDKQNESMVVWKNDELVGYGNGLALERLKGLLQLYFDLGMPSSSCFQLKVFPIDKSIKVTENQWLVKRKDSQFLWTLKAKP